MLKPLIAVAAIATAALVAVPGIGHAERAVKIPAPTLDVPAGNGNAVAILAGGCFWGMEAVFENMKGVRQVVSGYAGGTRETADYATVSTETTKHAEAIRIVYDPRQVSYGTLLRVYFSVAHDPTQLNRQGPDTGPSYRSAVFPQTPQQKTVAARYIAQLGATKAWGGKPIVTRVESGQFFPAEPYHQDFFKKNPGHPYIVRWDKPKVAAFKAGFPSLAI